HTRWPRDWSSDVCSSDLFDGLQLAPGLARKRLLLELAAGFPAPNDPKAQKELADILASLDGDYGKGKWCPEGEKRKCLDVTAVRSEERRVGKGCGGGGRM